MSSSDTDEASLEETTDGTSDPARESLLAQLTTELGDALVGSELRPGDDLWIRVHRDSWAHLADYARTGLGFAFFDFLSAIDWLPSPFGRDMVSQVDETLTPSDPSEADPMETGVAGGDTRFQVFARVYDIVNHVGVTAKVDLPDDDLRIDTWVRTYPGADWHERECWEMYGIEFDGHPGLKKLYLPGDFEGFPLRKDYPLLARRVKPWPGIVDVEPMPGDNEDGMDAVADEGEAGVAAGTDGGDA